jgi:transcriptional regulator with XRE-family HTH domain
VTARKRSTGRSAGTSRGRGATFDRTQGVARPKYGPQMMIRDQSGARAVGRPDEAEQQQLAATVGARIRELRRGNKLSLRDLERRCGVNRSAISRLERGLRRPRVSMLGWLAWGLVGPEAAEAVRDDLCSAAGPLMVADSQWSARAHARSAWQRLQAGGMELPSWLVAPHAVAMLGHVLPDRIDDLRKAQKGARSGQVPWPDWGIRSMEVFYLNREIDEATVVEYRRVGSAMAAADKANAARARRRRKRELRAAAGLTGADVRRPVRIPQGIPAADRRVYEQLARLDREASIAARLR